MEKQQKNDKGYQHFYMLQTTTSTPVTVPIQIYFNKGKHVESPKIYGYQTLILVCCMMCSWPTQRLSDE